MSGAKREWERDPEPANAPPATKTTTYKKAQQVVPPRESARADPPRTEPKRSETWHEVLPAVNQRLLFNYSIFWVFLLISLLRNLSYDVFDQSARLFAPQWRNGWRTPRDMCACVCALHCDCGLVWVRHRGCQVCMCINIAIWFRRARNSDCLWAFSAPSAKNKKKIKK